MFQSIATSDANNISPVGLVVTELRVEKLANTNTAEVIEFLNRRPIHTVTLLGFIRDNGIESKLNRGTFYSCRNRDGQLEGIALIGHSTLMETATDRALEAFAEIAKTCRNAHMIMGETDRVKYFWQNYQDGGQEMRLACRELLYELQSPFRSLDEVAGFRPARIEDLELVMPEQAQMALEESGIDPMQNDPEGFRDRCARRIRQGRTWVVVENNSLIFKADVMSETDDVAYVEGVWVNPENRGNNLGLRCMSQLAKILLTTKNSICLLVNERKTSAHNFYTRAGYEFQGVYDTIFLDADRI